MGRTKGKTTARGYGRKHQAERTKWIPRVKAGGVHCWRCHKPIHPNAKWDLGHDDLDRSITRGPEHQACNRATKTHAKQRRQGLHPPMALSIFGTPKPHAVGPNRTCEVCNADYRPSHQAQRACSRACGITLRRTVTATLPQAPKPQPASMKRRCPICNREFIAAPNRKTCGGRCSRQRHRERMAEKYRTDPDVRARVMAQANERNRRLREERADRSF